MPIFLFSTTIQHSLDITTWFPYTESAHAGNSLSEVMEELSGKDDIHSTLNMPFYTLVYYKATINSAVDIQTAIRPVPTPPPDQT